MNKTLKLIYNFDIITGNASAILTYKENNKNNEYYIQHPLYTFNCNLAIDLPLVKTNAYKVESDMWRKVGSSFASAIASMAIASIPYIGTTPSIIAGVTGLSSVFSAATAPLTNMPSYQIQNVEDDTWLNLKNGMKLQAVLIQPDVLMTNTQLDYFIKKVGCRTNTVRKVKHCIDFAQFMNIHIENLGNATNNEKNEVEEKLMNGIICPDSI